MIFKESKVLTNSIVAPFRANLFVVSVGVCVSSITSSICILPGLTELLLLASWRFAAELTGDSDCIPIKLF